MARKLSKQYIAVLAAAFFVGSTALTTKADLVVTGIVDPDVDFNARAIEVYINGTVDLSGVTLQRAANSAAYDENFSLTGTFTDTFVYFVANASAFNSVFGISGSNVIVSGAITGNGNDGFRFVDSTSTVVDAVGEGSSTNLYLDSYMYRVSETGPDGGFVPANWSIPGNNILDGLTAAQTRAAVPFGTYTIAPIPEPTAALCGSLLAGVLGLTVARRPQDRV
ncbi:hypothetical protein Pla108_32570 [Botrimarina colliarenosi]|uniref:PEP-CTERM protein-sorting domain-containing protein n=1 Tax=Botrimarina colliarenosi TaxID=2528001 RepID=A0A5C6A9T5_9BACT|nr:lamin tail domain-containing protein [Botrimarina colliarenosi]TWT96170.1 hypothetical protein Pla108_32570 [Botrimarina colliarenosi]